jgi:hypothetical protein
MLESIANKTIYFENDKGKLVRYAVAWGEMVNYYIREIKDTYGENTKVVIESR